VRLQHTWPACHGVRTVCLTALALGFSWVVSAQPIDLEEALKKPLSPGSVGLLVEHARGEKAMERLVAALEDPRPEVRAAAARVAFAGGATPLHPNLETALQKETDLAAAAAGPMSACTRQWRS